MNKARKRRTTSIHVKYKGRGVTLAISSRLKSYLMKNWGAPFIVVFMAMLMIAVGYLCYGLEIIANEIAIYAFYSLIVGVALQFVCYLKYGEDEE